MLRDILRQLYDRDLSKLKDELGLYADEADLWKVGGEISNPAGNLALHIVGNLKHFFGAVLGDTGYIRDRDAEFSTRGVSLSDIVKAIDETNVVVADTLSKLTEDDLTNEYPIEVFGHPMTTGWFLTHLSTHLTWHLGQINYHRRLLTRAPQ